MMMGVWISSFEEAYHKYSRNYYGKTGTLEEVDFIFVDEILQYQNEDCAKENQWWSYSVIKIRQLALIERDHHKLATNERWKPTKK